MCAPNFHFLFNASSTDWMCPSSLGWRLSRCGSGGFLLAAEDYKDERLVSLTASTPLNHAYAEAMDWLSPISQLQLLQFRI